MAFYKSAFVYLATSLARAGTKGKVQAKTYNTAKVSVGVPLFLMKAIPINSSLPM